MQEEFELTYLVKFVPEAVWSCPYKELLDIYLPAVDEHPTLRIRRSGDSFEITKKQPITEGDASHQVENTISLTADEFTELASIQGKRIHKIRYYYQEEGYEYEIDVFQDTLKGLVLADIEFTSSAEKATFVAPSWLLADVTQEKFIAGGMLCGKSYTDISDKLEGYNYQKLVV